MQLEFIHTIELRGIFWKHERSRAHPEYISHP